MKARLSAAYRPDRRGPRTARSCRESCV